MIERSVSKRDDGGHAFPCEGGSESGLYPHPGMTLRDWFAGKALEGLLSSLHNESGKSFEAGYAESAYALADATLAERAK